jgi:alanyl-tRNA synthetase
MTERLYYADSSCCEFDATIAGIDRRAGRVLVRLDRTAFYPTSGGQPFDTGTLGEARVIEVAEDGDGEIVHVVEPAPALIVGARVHGAVDWPRRFDHMQQHSGQHILSAAFDRLFGVATVSFHLGTEASTIDLSREMTLHEILAAEDEANRIVWQNRGIAIRFASAEEAARLPLRKASERSGTLRLVEVDAFDVSACGGTHVGRTGAVGMVAVGATDRSKAGQRVEFFCGGRALARLRTLREAAAACRRLLSVGAIELPASVERLQAEIRSQRRALAVQSAELTRFRAEELAASAEPSSVGRFVSAALDLDANGLKALASSIVSRQGLVVVLASTTVPALVVVARSADVKLEAHAVISALTAAFGGRGGGKADLAQGGGLNAPSQEILREAAARIRQA